MRIGPLLTFASIAFILMLLSGEVSYSADNRAPREDPYQVIVKNNLFKPLGWKPNPQGPSYQLLGTVITPGGQSKALLKIGNGTVYLKVGERIGNYVLKEVFEKRVVLEGKNGEIELKLEQIGFLKSQSKKERPRFKSGSSKSEQMEERPTTLPTPLSKERGEEERGEEARTGIRRILQEALERIPPEIRERFRNASPEERRRMIEEFRRRFRERRR